MGKAFIQTSLGLEKISISDRNVQLVNRKWETLKKKADWEGGWTERKEIGCRWMETEETERLEGSGFCGHGDRVGEGQKAWK